MTTLAEYMVLFGTNNRPSMLDKDVYDSWKSRMELYMQNREHGRMILESVEHGPLIWPTIEENGGDQDKEITRANTSGTGGNYSGQQRIVKCFNCQGEGHMARQCPKPKRKKDATWFREKFLLVEAQGNGSSSSSDSEVDSCSKSCVKAYATLKEQYDSLCSDYKKSQFNLVSYKAGLQSVEDRLVHYKKNEAVFEESINVLKLEVRLRDNALDEYKMKLEKAEKERDQLKQTLEKFQNSSKSLNDLLESQVIDKFKTGLGYNAATPAVESFVNLSDKSGSDKGYHSVPPPVLIQKSLRFVKDPVVKYRPPMPWTGRYSSIYHVSMVTIDTKPNGGGLKKSILSGPYVPTTVQVQAVVAAEGRPAVPQHTSVQTVLNMTPENKEHFQSEKEAIFLLLTGIGDEIYSIVDAVK
ncbi:putative ribonuclease H-like domain-containing protein [Tanacetum coccineum]